MLQPRIALNPLRFSNPGLMVPRGLPICLSIAGFEFGRAAPATEFGLELTERNVSSLSSPVTPPVANLVTPNRGSRLGTFVACNCAVIKTLRSIAPPPECNSQLLHYWTERQDDFAVHLVEHLREARVDRGEPTENSLIAGKLFETRTCVNEIANRQEKEKNRQRTENDLAGNMQTQRANEHHCSEQTPHEKISRHRSVVGGCRPS